MVPYGAKGGFEILVYAPKEYIPELKSKLQKNEDVWIGHLEELSLPYGISLFDDMATAIHNWRVRRKQKQMDKEGIVPLLIHVDMGFEKMSKADYDFIKDLLVSYNLHPEMWSIIRGVGTSEYKKEEHFLRDLNHAIKNNGELPGDLTFRL